MKLVKGMVTTLFSIIFMTANIANATTIVTGDYNGDGNQDSFNQADNKGDSSSLTANEGSTISNFHISWTDAHPDISEIADWSAQSYGAFSANLNSSPGDELLLLGKKEIILLHGDIITPILIPKDVQNAIVSWSSSGVATYTSFDLDADPDQFNVLFGDFDGDGYQEFVLQGKSSGSTSYIMNSDGSISETLSNGTHGMDWSAASVTLTVSDLNGDGIDDLSAVSTDSNVEDLHVYMSSGKVDSVNTYFGEASALGFDVGAIAGEFRVDEGGQANYSIPIYTPVGVAGVSPTVSLNYSSGGGNGIAGIGWNLTAAGGISLCGKKQQVDYEHGSINFDENDRFCFAGQRLVVVSGEYGEPDSEYRTLIDTQTKIIAYGSEGSGPQYFKVWHKDGSINAYGITDNSRFHANKNGIVQTDILTWAQTYSEDRYGNRINYFYTLDETIGQNHIDKIEYDPSVVIKFNYTTDRPDYHEGYFEGGKAISNKRLDSIIVSDNDIEVRRYDFDYEQSLSKQSRMTSVTESKGGIALKPTTFEWSDAVKGIQADLNEVNDGFKFDYGTFMNIDGDLTPDWMYLKSNGDGTTSTAILYQSNGNEFVESCRRTISTDVDSEAGIKVFDLDGNGTDELIVSNGALIESYSFDTVPCSGSYLSYAATPKRTLSSISKDQGEYFFGDLNGDALPDLLYSNSGKYYVQYHLGSSGNAWGYYGSENEVSFTTTSLVGGTSKPYQTHSAYADFNSDGLLDVILKVEFTKYVFDDSCFEYCTVLSDHWIVFAANDDGSFTEIANLGDLGDAVTKNNDLKIVDLNNDGQPDVVYRNKGQDRWHYKQFTGTEFLTSKTLYVDDDKQIHFGDHDRDGLTEVMFIEGSKLKYREFDASGVLATSIINTGVGAENAQFMAQVDLNGDGELDIVSVVEDAHSGYTHYEQHLSYNKSPFVARDRITEIDNGLGNTTLITYKALTDPAHPDLYDDDNGNHQGWDYDSNDYLTFKQKGPKFVVQKAESSSPSYDDANNQNTIEYRYGRLKSHSLYGGLGFEWLETIDPQTNIITRTSYKQEYPYIGMPEKTEVWYGERTAERLISKATSEYKKLYPHACYGLFCTIESNLKVVYPYLHKSIEDSYDFNVSTLKQGELVSRVITVSDYNSYGDPYAQNTYTCYGNSPDCENSGWLKRIRTTNTYSPANKTDWILGRLTKSKVEHFADGESTQTRISAFEYDTVTGILTAEIIEPDSTNREEYLRTEYLHDTYGNTIRKTVCDNTIDCSTLPTSDPFDLYRVFRTTETEYDSDGRYVTKSINGYGQTVSEVLQRNELGQATLVSSISGAITQKAFGVFGQEFYTKSADGNWSKIQKALCEAILDCPTEAIIRVETFSADGSHKFTYIDALGRTVEEKAQGFGDYDIITEFEYDANGRLYQTSLPYKSTEPSSVVKTKNTYDILDRISRVDYPDGSRDLRYYDGYDTVERAIKTRIVNDKNQNKTEFTNAAGELVKVTDNNNKSLTYRYNATGDILTVHFDGVKQSEIEYTSLGRKAKMWDWDKGAQNGNLFWEYSYNALGELVLQKDPKGQSVSVFYDRNGRKIKQLDKNSGGESVADFRWTYDNSVNQSGTTGKLTNQKNELDSELVIDYQYDNLGRNDVTTKTIAGVSFVNDIVFDSIGRVIESYDASGSDHGIRNTYNSKGYLTKISETKANDSTVYREILDMDQFGNVTKEIYGNGVITEREYEDTTGRLLRINTTDGVAVRQNLDYRWDSLGRLERRESITKELVEIFTYDNLNRIKTVNGANLYNYDAKGNITWKQGVGSYSYNASCNGVIAGSHAVTAAGGKTYCYDLNGNMISGDGRTAEYSVFDKATKITKNGHTTEFAYSSERSRYKRIDSNTAGVTTTFYLGGTEYIQGSNGEIFYRRNLPGAVINVPVTGSMTTKYLHTDHLGSTDVITDQNGNTAQEVSFDVFGNKRNVSTWNGEITTIEFSPLSITSKAYTGHESADEVGVIHMNGRIYDPKLGRFMQADPFIDGVTDSQGYNRYTYVRNNPLAYTDPTGFKRSGGLKNFQRLAKGAFFFSSDTGVQQAISTVTTVVVGAYCPPCAPGVAAFFSAASAGANGGNMKDSARAGARAYMTAYVSSQIASGIGEHYGTLSSNTLKFRSALMHGSLGGVMNVLRGGKFGHGFASSFVSKFALTHLDLTGEIDGKKFADKPTRIMIAGIVGGTVSQATGGKFANGAVQSALQWAFNAETARKRIYMKIADGVWAGYDIAPYAGGWKHEIHIFDIASGSHPSELSKWSLDNVHERGVLGPAKKHGKELTIDMLSETERTNVRSLVIRETKKMHESQWGRKGGSKWNAKNKWLKTNWTKILTVGSKALGSAAYMNLFDSVENACGQRKVSEICH